MATANVWHKEVEEGLVKEILSCTKYLSASGVETPLSDGMAWVRSPDEELRIEDYPCVIISELYEIYDARRWCINPSRVSYGGGKVVLQEPSQPFNLYYQLDFWSRFKEDMNVMTRTWFQHHGNSFNLSVVDDGGTERSCNAYREGSMKPFDYVTNTKKAYRMSCVYVVWVELDTNEDYEANVVLDIVLDMKQGGGNVIPG